METRKTSSDENYKDTSDDEYYQNDCQPVSALRLLNRLQSWILPCSFGFRIGLGFVTSKGCKQGVALKQKPTPRLLMIAEEWPDLQTAKPTSVYTPDTVKKRLTKHQKTGMEAYGLTSISG